MLQNEVTYCCLSSEGILEVGSIYWPELFPALPVTTSPISRRGRCTRLLPTPQIKTLHLSFSNKIFSQRVTRYTEYFDIVYGYMGSVFRRVHWGNRCTLFPANQAGHRCRLTNKKNYEERRMTCCL